MGCRRDEAKGKLKRGHFRCKKCGAAAKKAKRLCKPKIVTH